MDTILLATDGSATAKKAARLAGDLAKCSNAEIIVFSVAQPIMPNDLEPMNMGFVDEPLRRAQEEADRQADEYRRAGLKATSETKLSPAVAAAIVEEAEQTGADMIVMGTHGRSGLSRAILGSVADRVLRTGRIPVLVAKQDEP